MRDRRRRTGLAKRVLVVEDDEDTRKLLVAAIADEGFEPIPALDGRHALRTALAVEPSAIVLDLMLPGTDGAAFARQYHEQTHRDPPIVVVSARYDAEAVAKRIGARAMVPKPFDVDQLMALLRTAMSHPTSRAQVS